MSDGRVLVVGGFGFNASSGFDVVGCCEIYNTTPNEGKADRDWTVRTGLSSTVTQRLMISVTPMRRLAQFAGVNMTNMTSRLRHRFLGLHNQAWHGGNVLAAKGRSRFRIHED